MNLRLRATRLLALAALVPFLVWMAMFVWHYVQYRTCATKACPPSTVEPPIRLSSGRTLPVVTSWLSEDGHLMLDYLTAEDRHSYRDLCEEAEEVWASIGTTERVETATLVYLGPTTSTPEYLGLGAFFLPTYRCCVSTYITVRKDETGEWQFRKECPSE